MLVLFPLTFLVMSFVAQRFLIFTLPSVSVFVVVACVFGVLSKKPFPNTRRDDLVLQFFQELYSFSA